MNFPEKLDMLMEERDINKSKLSKDSGIPYTTITSLYEKGDRDVRLSTLKKLSSFFGCSIDYLTAESDQDDQPTDIKQLHPMEVSLIRMYRKAKRSRKTIVENLLRATVILLNIKELEPDKPMQLEMPEEFFQ